MDICILQTWKYNDNKNQANNRIRVRKKCGKSIKAEIRWELNMLYKL